ncbi:hypothetical protein FOVG_00671 [Fusarium oxysporum f. sp. pisi HDV247]|uniref:Uncharacterized protein n=1 Tax=Fusarium oxysporum f. sp. pisi HDV247 TaxID=1080344 RepID=W9Q4C3_FUSOX|nr:hypothetical protein FOVG_00671 [Fusarium oxysporum f. sp. pisi HDV247]EXA52344.1 hypothetical protein FOVG_00671 [Fusarium oxysporum f. sp. pisi HDV247]
MTETEQRQQRQGRPDDGAKKIECHEDIFWSSISARVSDKDHKNWDRMGKDVHFAYRLGGLCLPFCFFFFFLFLFSPLTLGSHLACTVFHLASFSRFFFFLLLLFIIPGLDRCCGLGSFAGGPTAEGYVAVFPCTISVLVYKTWQGYWKRIERGKRKAIPMLWPC